VPDELAAELGALRRRYKFTGVSFHGGSLTELPAGFARAKAWLTHLSLAHNPLQTLPAVVLQLANLEHLDLTGTELRELPAGLVKLRQLRELDLSDARFLTELPEVVCALPALEVLCLSGKIKVLPAAIGRLKSLKVLNLVSSRIARLPPEVRTLPNLRRVEARFSRLHIAKAQAVLPPGCTLVS
jgi:internalin A